MDILNQDIQAQNSAEKLGQESDKLSTHRTRTYLLLLTVASASSALYTLTVISHLASLLGAGINTWLLLVGIFFTSMIIGAKLASYFSKRIFNPLKLFALLQAGTGFLAVGLFSAFIFLASKPIMSHQFTWLAALLLITPQAILLGVIFPLLSFGILRCGPVKTGRSISLIYFCYGSGMATGLALAPLLGSMTTGIAATIQLSCLVHIMTAFFVCSLSVKDGRNPLPLEHPLSRNLCKKPLHPRLIFVFLVSIGVVTSLYEIMWIPFLSAINSKLPYSAELIFGSAILGLALGAFATKNKSKKKIVPLHLLVKLKLFILFLLTTSLVLNNTFTGDSISAQVLTSFAQQAPLASLFFACLIAMIGTLSLGATMPLTIYMERNKRWDEAVFGNHYAHALVGVVAGISFSFLLLY